VRDVLEGANTAARRHDGEADRQINRPSHHWLFSSIYENGSISGTARWNLLFAEVRLNTQKK